MLEEETKQVTGVVVDCMKLNVRSAPNRNAEVIYALNAGDRVLIEEGNSTKEYYNVYTAAGIEGYCAKEYIAIEG